MTFDMHTAENREPSNVNGAREVFEFLTLPEQIGRMCILSDCGLPAISAVAYDLEQTFGDASCFPMKEKCNRQTVGRMVRYILKQFGYEKAASGNIRLKDCFHAKHFKSGGLYRKTKEGAYRIVMAVEQKESAGN